MERKIGETFEFEGKKLQVKESASSGCGGCFFDEQRILCSKNVAGYCDFRFRADKKKVIFVEVKEETKEQHQEEQPQKLNLCEILKDCPRGTKFYSPVYGWVTFDEVDDSNIDYEEIIIYHNYGRVRLDKFGVVFDFRGNGECIIFPSKDQRDWSKFNTPWLKKERFDPKTFKAFDKVLVRDTADDKWICEHFSYMIHDNDEWTFVATTKYLCCIPYNDDTKHLVGTTDEAPDFYRYWED